MKRYALLALGLTVGVTACDGFREAMTAHVDTVARAGSQELSVDRLAEMLAHSEVPLAPDPAQNKDLARAITDVWVNYQLVGHAAARNDSLNSTNVVDDAMWMEITRAKTGRFYELVSKQWESSDSSGPTDAQYQQGDLLAAAHILFAIPEGASTAVVDPVRAQAEAVRARATSANFGALARQYSSDPGSKDRGGLYVGFSRGEMVPEFESAVVALRPGEISPLVRTQYGFHIIRRSELAEVRDELGPAFTRRTTMAAESTYLAGIEQSGRVDVKPRATALVRNIAENPGAFRDDRTVLATSTAGNFTAATMARYIRAFPPQMQAAQQIASMPDSMVPMFVRQLVRQDLVVRMADSAKAVPDSSELAAIRGSFTALVPMVWQRLGVSPQTLADSARDDRGRAAFAAQRVEQYMDGLLASSAEFVEIPPQLEHALHTQYSPKVVDAGLDRAVQKAMQLRTALDAARGPQQPQQMPPQQQQPPSAVPMPPAPPEGGR
jgi:hypothetical protein